MPRKSEKPISLKFLFFITIVVVVIIWYISLPNDIKKINKSKTFDEMLEYSNAGSYSRIKTEEKKSENIPQNPLETVSTEPVRKSTTKKQTAVRQNTVKQVQSVKQNKQDEYDKLLNSLCLYPAKSIHSVEIIVNKILKYKGYPENTIKVVPNTPDQSKAKTQGSYMAAAFEFSSGNMLISETSVYKLDIKEVIAIIAHELDHFDKIAKVCKSMGVPAFKAFMKENKIEINDVFWTRSSVYADINNFDAQYYKDALERFVGQTDLELLSSYADFYRIAENMRNPLEISAYEVSDYIYDFYKLPVSIGPMQSLTRKFNSVDWAIYDAISSDPILKRERIALFDYFFMTAIVDTFPNFSRILDNCIQEKNGDLTDFWLAFERTIPNFYGKGQFDAQTYKILMTLLDTTEKEAKNGISDNQAADAIKNKINTLLSNIVYPNAIKHIRAYSLDYLQFIKEKNISSPSDELKYIITLLCIDNDLRANVLYNDFSLYYLKIPEELVKLYNIKEKSRRFHFIFKNPAFISMLKEKQSTNSRVTEQSLLIDLLMQNRLVVKITG